MPKTTKGENWEKEFDKLYFNFKRNPDMAEQIKHFIKLQLQIAYGEGHDDGTGV